MKKLDQMENMLYTVRDDVVKFETKGNQMAGTRVRKTMQAIKVLAQEVRVIVQETKTKSTEEA
jgi:hypothetical protein